ncbi:NAD(P)/FAD-dependent oxidoreductase [Haliscomenobacter hydrossis]|uniref:FAD dependent oxidoreductase n=1 Tax=Haliscomenobacter hydrossis (strain ATCC 27775 / DSM 1100 / LMG 10767 / O) TaxID=760192 RepID=F4L6E2_HALH1|nr:FAD-dependent monooxygenase [Haliscomenobacter hydrossis]AEE48824.1 FAD dependent oxidoreductase [Haliscomenobacter hydrossis DSM 1100]
MDNKIYPYAIIGGGLGGLCLAIQLARKGMEVILFEKNTFPQHKVCGEYISMESWDFLCDLGVPLNDLGLPQISQLGISAQNGFMLNSPLALGGFGISRYTLDDHLCQIARKWGVTVLENCKVMDVQISDLTTAEISTSQGKYRAQLVCGSFGKYAPSFAKSPAKIAVQLPNYIGVKYYIETDLAPDRIELHNFKDGYCGILKVDLNRYCLCYLSKSSNLQRAGNDIKAMEETVLYKNPFLKKYFTQSTFLFEKPMVISNVYFHPKDTYLNGMFLLGDAAGAISPLCGNGMSMAMRASKLLADLMLPYAEGRIDKAELVNRYTLAWKDNFSTRIWAGQHLQHLFGKNTSTHLALKMLHYLPALKHKLIKLTHGEVF